MAEDQDKDSKTEAPTQRRLDEARRKGEIAKSVDFSSWAVLATVSGTVALAGGWMCRTLAAGLLPFLDHPERIDLDGTGGQQVLHAVMTLTLPVMAVVFGAAVAAGVAGNVVQQGFIWAPERLKPSFEKVSPMSGFKRIFGPDGMVHFIKSLLKIGIVSGVGWWAIAGEAGSITGMTGLGPAGILQVSARIMTKLALAVVCVVGVGAVLDWILQRQRFMARMRMSREDVKEENKQQDGDPHVKARLRQIRMQRSRQRMMQNLPTATVVIMNPTHFAVALRYEPNETPAPVCVAKGVDELALRIRAMAEDLGIAVVEDPPLARALFATMDVDDTIPTGHFEAVARIIGFVLNGGRKSRARPVF